MKQLTRILALAFLLSIVFIFLKAGGTDSVSVSKEVARAQIATSPASFTFLFYNTENLFDAINDPASDDAEFLPEGDRRWTYTRYYRKLQSVAKVILSSGDSAPPAFVGLCEVENRGVAEALVRMTPLSRYDYGIVHFESKDTRGIDLCLLYNREVASMIISRAIYPVTKSGDTLPVARPVLYVKMDIEGKPLHLLLNHWPSRRGGVMSASFLRRSLAEFTVAFTDSIFQIDGKDAAVMIAGDLNTTPSNDEIMPFVRAGFVNLLSAAEKRGEGTYKYRGVWQILDHIIVSGSMTDGRSGYRIEDSMIHSPGFLLIDDEVYPGRKPYSTFEGYRYSGGYSDHLPVKVVVSYQH